MGELNPLRDFTRDAEVTVGINRETGQGWIAGAGSMTQTPEGTWVSPSGNIQVIPEGDTGYGRVVVKRKKPETQPGTGVKSAFPVTDKYLSNFYVQLGSLEKVMDTRDFARQVHLIQGADLSSLTKDTPLEKSLGKHF